MKHWEGRIWLREGKSDKRIYYYRRRIVILENGVKKPLDVRRKLGTNYERAIRTAKELDIQTDALVNGEGPKIQLSLTEFIGRFVKYLSEERRILAWKSVRANLTCFQSWAGECALESVTRPVIEKYLMWRGQHVTASTVISSHRDLRRLFVYAMTEGYMPANPAIGIRLPRASRTEYRLPTHAELQLFFEELKDRKYWLYQIMLTLVCTGCRLGEALAARWEHVDFTRGTITFERRKVRDVMSLPMAHQLKHELLTLWEASGWPQDGLVFINQHKRPFNNGRIERAFKPVAKRIGMPWLLPKTFRRLAATWAVEKTGNVRVAQMLLGHTSVRTTELYLGRGAEARALGVQAVEAMLEGHLQLEVGTKAGTNG